MQLYEAQISDWMMAAFRFMLQLLFLGSAIIPEYLQTDRCSLLPNAVAGNFSISVIPNTYEANTTYAVTVSDSRNHTDKTVSAVLLQALSSNVSVGEWKDTTPENCSNIDTAVVNTTNTTANWTSPSDNSLSVTIRAYILFSNNSVDFSYVTLNEKVANTTTAPPSTTPNSVSAVHSSTVFLASMQVVLLFVTSKLLS